METIIPRMNDEELDVFSDLTHHTLARHLADDEYYRIFLKD